MRTQRARVIELGVVLCQDGSTVPFVFCHSLAFLDPYLRFYWDISGQSTAFFHAAFHWVQKCSANKLKKLQFLSHYNFQKSKSSQLKRWSHCSDGPIHLNFLSCPNSLSRPGSFSSLHTTRWVKQLFTSALFNPKINWENTKWCLKHRQLDATLAALEEELLLLGWSSYLLAGGLTLQV